MLDSGEGPMAQRTTVDLLIAETEEVLSRYRVSYAGLPWRQKVLLLVELSAAVKKLGVHSNPQAARVSARERIRLYLVEHVRVIIRAAELEVVSGISDYGRRVRELRVQDGYKILTGHSNDPELGVNIGPSEYILLEADPDVTAARRWHIANRIRRETQGGSKGRLLRYLRENVGQVVTSEELAYVARASQFGRRVRELRTEEGYAVATRFTGRPDLGMGEYVLETLDRIAEAHDRRIPFGVQKVVYERAGNACELCGWTREGWTREDPRILELHHLQQHAAGGQNTPENLIALCSRCHDEVHGGRRNIPPQLLGRPA